LHRTPEIPAGLWLGATCVALLLAAGPDNSVAEAPDAGSGCMPGGQLRVELFGNLPVRIDWHAPGLDCDGMPRPEGAGARLRFTGHTPAEDGDRRLTFIIALPELQRGAPASETPATVTLIEEDRGRFYSSAGIDVCWADVDEQARDGETDSGRYRISGLVYCVAPLAEQNGTGGVSFTDLQYSGWLDWTKPQ